MVKLTFDLKFAVLVAATNIIMLNYNFYHQFNKINFEF